MDGEEAHLDGPILAELEDIMEDDFGILIETYLADAADKITQLDTALKADDASALREISHSLKGASCNIGALPLSHLFEKLEDLAKQERTEEIPPLMPPIEVEFSTIRSLLEAKIL